MRNICKLISSFFLSLVLLNFSSCRNEQAAISNENNKPILTNKIINLKDSKHKHTIVKELEGVKNYLLNYTTKDKDGKMIDFKNISINTTHVIMFENGPNYHNYTFRIERENEFPNGVVENLVLSPFSDGTYEAVLVTYYFSNIEKEKIVQGLVVDSKGKVTSESINWRNRTDKRTKRFILVNPQQKEQNAVKY